MGPVILVKIRLGLIPFPRELQAPQFKGGTHLVRFITKISANNIFNKFPQRIQRPLFSNTVNYDHCLSFGVDYLTSFFVEILLFDNGQFISPKTFSRHFGNMQPLAIPEPGPKFRAIT